MTFFRLLKNKKIWSFGMFTLLLSSNFSFAETKKYYYQQWQTISKQKAFQQGISVYQKAIQEYPDEAWFYIFLAHSYKTLQNYDASLPHFAKAYQLNRTNKDILSNVYHGYMAAANYHGFQKRNWSRAAELYGQATKVDTKIFQAFNMQGNALHNEGRLEEAFKAMRMAFLINPQHVHGGYKGNFRATMLAGMNKYRNNRH